MEKNTNVCLEIEPFTYIKSSGLDLVWIGAELRADGYWIQRKRAVRVYLCPFPLPSTSAIVRVCLIKVEKDKLADDAPGLDREMLLQSSIKTFIRFHSQLRVVSRCWPTPRFLQFQQKSTAIFLLKMKYKMVECWSTCELRVSMTASKCVLW